ncbi:fumarylacetoacetate hydrolase family protein [Pseudomaricurvus alcaniphilus]|uniref:fumarylacetoacetate hydrolase family protein n=1 Tax=Pseudomaricurvus alcaniphilus TaxID=1166482 RepID=UPI001409404B|nr:fumarylacetoacetate hydrolase family protein [Pseudomaricurvus alcaniphilus]NHN36525.1 fumarylacetoacetate hydrolase family protein [Pseudomaricurvus alcaniphilus]
MKLARFSVGGECALGLVIGDSVSDLNARIESLPSKMIDLIEGWDEYRPLIEAAGLQPDYLLSEVTLLAPIERPGKILGIGLNYADHVAEADGKMAIPSKQLWFAKPATAITGPYADVELPIASELLDYEAEMVFVIGKRCRHVPTDKANEVIFGYCAGNDVSVRDWQFHTNQVMMGKCFDTHAPYGPYIVTPDEIDPENLAIRALVNGEVRQESNTSQLIFSCADQVAYLSQAMTLEPGDIIFTGTPNGVGALMTPPCYLKPGDIVRIEIDGIGYIENTIVNEIANEIVEQ